MFDIKPFLKEHAEDRGRAIPARLQAMLALLESLRDTPQLDLTVHLSGSGQSLISHEGLGNRAHQRLDLKAINKNHGRRSSNLHSWGASLLRLLEEAGFASLDLAGLERPPQELDRKYELFESIRMVQNTTEKQRAWSS